jgi:hydrogenase expression/formation protein HypD
LMGAVFAACSANWRGIGLVPASGLKLKNAYRQFDAEQRFDVNPGPSREPEGCICGSILRGVSTPLGCRLFNKVCTPENPVGPCMVSSEGSCATYYHFGASNDG